MEYSRMESAYRRAWSLLTMRAGEYSSTDTTRFDRLHRIEDPYEMGSNRELVRFEKTNDLLQRTCPDIANILEIGSGEGIQTRYLARLTPHITGIEVSPRAVARARERIADVDFIVGAAEDVATLVANRKVDLAMACEMLYLTPHAARILEDLKQIAARIFVTNYAKRAPDVAPYLTGDGWQRLENIEVEGTVWWCYLWNRPGEG